MKKKNKYSRPLTAVGFAIFAVILSSCLISTESYRRTRIFDLGAVNGLSERLEVKKFENPNMYRHSFAYRVAENEIVKDDFNKWAMLPENLIVSRMKNAFSSDDKSPVITGKIIRFEFDITKKIALLNLAYRLQEGGKLIAEGDFRVQTSFVENDPAEMAKAMAKCLDEFIAEISRKLKERDEA